MDWSTLMSRKQANETGTVDNIFICMICYTYASFA
jgi:hypothetical protein